jgi:hypothetical protein
MVTHDLILQIQNKYFGGVTKSKVHLNPQLLRKALLLVFKIGKIGASLHVVRNASVIG